MVTDTMVSADALWQLIRRESEVAASDPLLRGSSAAILGHPDLGHAVAFVIGQRLGTGNDRRALLTRIANEAFHAEPDLVEAASRDLQGIIRRDPATKGFLPPLLNFKGYVALQAWRVSHWLWCRGRTDLALLMQSQSSERLQVSIHPSASVGTSVFLDHATGIIVGAFASIGDEVTMLQNVTIGRPQADPDAAPRIGRGVFIGAGATIIGDVSVGDFAKIGAGSVVLADVPPGCTAVGVTARLTNCPDVSRTAPSLRGA
ncbi:serine acetyltransferase [Bradyrhizobium sp. Leo170]|uniref:serine O-acetyltransferase n=1 Tax=Bradyrhizobium sp. Leo170 TaxID=1571199 RepID=UPI00102E4460|nr:serine acetyltransferase [Bradyrhizobium sp. Leo170]TAI64510.1 serine acetyltransferase [Bradyrhizobium sp. Leo170]